MTTVGATENNECAEIPQICTKSQESSYNITEGGEDEWLISIKSYVNDTTEKPQIERVPSLMRVIKSNKDCYDPLVVSIGPYHHGKPELEAFEKLKIPIAQKFVRACGNQVSIEQLYEEVAMVGASVRKCYEKDSTGFDDNKFNRIMFLDACFVLYVLCTNLQEEEQNEVTERLVKSFYSVLRDLLLLENQIPLLVLKVLLKFRVRREKDQTLFKQKFLEPYILMPPQGNSCTNAVKKFLAQMKGCCTTSDQEMNKWKLELDSSPHLLHLLREHFIKPYMYEIQNKNTFVQWESYRSVAKVADSVRECYEEGFIGMMLLDGCFVIQFICILTNTESNSSNNTETEPKEGDLILETKCYLTLFLMLSSRLKSTARIKAEYECTTILAGETRQYRKEGAFFAIALNLAHTYLAVFPRKLS
ncbi:unnamed protein product [Fraxinus pennsylvanica]|uniref:Uncharacterized protein n=1 Tax=Fraxinus pennsylvanica TaxID=56036 RepID=A0AAD2A135_9LAMI|nr:unnamed protein product [Fraxinus pennsylvanica]